MDPNPSQPNIPQNTPSIPLPTDPPLPPSNQIKNEPPAKEGTSKKRTIIAIFLLIFVYLIGVIFVWYFTNWPRWAKNLVILPIFLGIIAILLSVVFIAIKPSGYVGKNKNTENVGSKDSINSGAISRSNDTTRRSNVAEILNSIGAYTVDHQGQLPQEITTTVTEIGDGANQVDLCKEVVPKYMLDFPMDPKFNNGSDITTCENYETGYAIVKNVNNRVTVSAPSAEGDVEIKITR